MSANPQDDEDDVPPVARPPRWLPLLEQELKSRLAWADEAISPFARAMHPSKSDRLLPVLAKPAPLPARTEPVAEPVAA